MKNQLFVLFMLLSNLLFAQAPEKINYQAIIRNSAGNILTNSMVALRVQIRQTSATGTVVYQERHNPVTSAQGLINLSIGLGTIETGTFNGIAWNTGTYFIQLWVNFNPGILNGGTWYDFGTQQLLSVPYALFAKSAENQLGVKTTTEPVGTNCSTGGVKLEYGFDTNFNDLLDASEINPSLTQFICNGQNGIQGPQGIQGIAGPIGATGQQGPIGLTGPVGATGATGPQGSVGLTGLTGAIGLTGAQGVQGVSGTNGTNGINGTNGTNGTNGINGINGSNGQNTLVKTSIESAGANCTTGGMKIEYGLDTNNNGTLDVSEINASLTKYVCNGAVGATGPAGVTGAAGAQGPIGLTGPQGATGAAGQQGSLGLTGAVGPTGSQGPQGVAGTNGTNGLNALIKTTTESAGANCTNGGTKIETGLDANGNGVLDAGEINASQTKYVCNGVGGTVNNSGSGVNAPHGYKVITSDTSFVINENKLIEVILISGNGGNGGSNVCYGGGIGGTGIGLKFYLSADQGDTLNFKVGTNGLNGCSFCIPGQINNGSNGTSGSPSILSINSWNHLNYLIKTNPGSAGSGAYGCSSPANGSNGDIQHGSSYNSSGVFIINQIIGSGAFVSIRW